MLFLLRCLFWLGLVFSHIAEQQGFNPAALLDQRPAATGENVNGLGGMALEAASQLCRAEPEKCAALAVRASRLAPQFAPNPAASRDTLNAGDRAPAWRPHPRVAPDSDRRG